MAEGEQQSAAQEQQNAEKKKKAAEAEKAYKAVSTASPTKIRPVGARTLSTASAIGRA